MDDSLVPAFAIQFEGMDTCSWIDLQILFATFKRWKETLLQALSIPIVYPV